MEDVAYVRTACVVGAQMFGKHVQIIAPEVIVEPIEIAEQFLSGRHGCQNAFCIRQLLPDHDQKGNRIFDVFDHIQK